MRQSGWALLPALFLGAGFFQVSAGELTIKDLQKQVQELKDSAAQKEQQIAALKTTGAGPAGLGGLPLVHSPTLLGREINISGFVDASFQFNCQNPKKPASNLLRAHDASETCDFSLNLVELRVDGSAKNAGEAGFRFDLVWGNDAPVVVPDIPPIRQAYLDYIVNVGNGLHLYAGKLETPMGCESVETQENWNSTRSLNFSYGGAPYGHTGLGVEYKVLDNLTLKAYLVNGMDVTPDNNNAKSAVLSADYQPFTKLFLSAGFMYGAELAGNDADARCAFNLNAVYEVLENVSVALDFNAGLEEDQEGVAPGVIRDAEWFGAALYVRWLPHPDWALSARGEYFNDRDTGSRTGYPAELSSVTFTLCYLVSKSLETRLELRHDSADRSIFPSDKPSRLIKNQDTATISWLYKF